MRLATVPLRAFGTVTVSSSHSAELEWANMAEATLAIKDGSTTLRMIQAKKGMTIFNVPFDAAFRFLSA